MYLFPIRVYSDDRQCAYKLQDMNDISWGYDEPTQETNLNSCLHAHIQVMSQVPAVALRKPFIVER